jgi:hypothetical protein
MLEQLISDLIVALQNNTAAVKAASNLTVTSSPVATTTTLTAVVEPTATPEAEKPKTVRKPKADTPKTETPAVVTPTITPEVVAEKKPVTLEEVRALGQSLLDLTGDAEVIRGFVKSKLPNEAKPALRHLQPEHLEEAHAFLSGVIAKLPKATVEEYYAKKKAA